MQPHCYVFVVVVVIFQIEGCYFLIRDAQTKITLLIFWNNWVIKENEIFLLVEPCSRVTSCVEIKLQYFFRKYILVSAYAEP